MCGLASDLYVEDAVAVVVTLQPKARLHACTVASTQHLAAEFACLGTLMRRLRVVSECAGRTYDAASAVPSGEIFTATAMFVNRFLRRLHLRIFRLQESMTSPLALSHAVRGIRTSLTFLARLLFGSDDTDAAPHTHAPPFRQSVLPRVPFGLELLTRLYDAARHAIGSSQQAVALLAFTSGCQPYLRFLEVACYDGVHRVTSSLAEFGVGVDAAALACRDARFWTMGVSVGGAAVDGAWPSFVGTQGSKIAAAMKVSVLWACVCMGGGRMLHFGCALLLHGHQREYMRVCCHGCLGAS